MCANVCFCHTHNLTVCFCHIHNLTVCFCHIHNLTVCFCHIHNLTVRIPFRQYTLYFTCSHAFLLHARFLPTALLQCRNKNTQNKGLYWTQSLILYTSAFLVSLMLSSLAPEYKPFQACSVLMAFVISIFSLVDQSFFYLVECIHILSFRILVSFVGPTLCVHPQYFSFNHIDLILLLFVDVFDGHAVHLLYFPAHKTHFFSPRKM
jgi:hypothetical protein